MCPYHILQLIGFQTRHHLFTVYQRAMNGIRNAHDVCVQVRHLYISGLFVFDCGIRACVMMCPPFPCSLALLFDEQRTLGSTLTPYMREKGMERPGDCQKERERRERESQKRKRGEKREREREESEKRERHTERWGLWQIGRQTKQRKRKSERERKRDRQREEREKRERQERERRETASI